MVSKDGELQLGSDPTDEEVDELFERLGKMGTEERRKTLLLISGGQTKGSVKEEVNPKPYLADSSAQASLDGHSARTTEPGSTFLSHPMYASQGQGYTMVPSPSQGYPNPQVLLDTTPRKIKNFSGNAKPGPGEADYRHWRRAAQRIMDDRDLSQNRKQTILVQSLTGTAEDCIDLMRNAPPAQILALLDATFGSTNDGQELLIDFYQLNQLATESTSEYLTRLYVKLCEVVTHEGLEMGQVPDELVRQFKRGTTDDDMLLKLRLDDMQPRAVDYPTLIARVRREEGRRTERRLRLRKARSSAATATPEMAEVHDAKPVTDTSAEVEALRKRIAELEAKQDVNTLAQRVQQLESSVSKPSVFCYRCGQDGHVAYDCPNRPNKKLVEEKRAARRNKSGNGTVPRQKANAGGRV